MHQPAPVTLANRMTSPGISRSPTPGSAPVTAAGEGEWSVLVAPGDTSAVPICRIRYRDTFLKSEVWRGLRAARLEKDSQCCQGCGFRSTHNDVHHIFYPLDWNGTGVDDVRTLCRDCHNIVEALTHPASVHSRAEGLRRWRIAKEKITSFREWRAKLLRPSVK